MDNNFFLSKERGLGRSPHLPPSNAASGLWHVDFMWDSYGCVLNILLHMNIFLCLVLTEQFKSYVCKANISLRDIWKHTFHISFMMDKIET